MLIACAYHGIGVVLIKLNSTTSSSVHEMRQDPPDKQKGMQKLHSLTI